MDNRRHTRSSIGALRDAFGDNKPPDISRKITACVACRKQKIKCQRRNGETQCTRCKRRGLSCTVNRSLQMLLEEDVSWKDEMEHKIHRLESAVASLAPTMSLSQGQTSQSRVVVDTVPDSPGCIQTPVINNADSSQRDDSGRRLGSSVPDSRDIVMDLDSGPGTMPGFYVPESSTSARQAAFQDFISRGLVSRDKAQEYFLNYQNRLDHFPYRILGDVDPSPTLDSVRTSSPLLAVAVCAVGSLHLAASSSSEDFDACYNELVALTAKQSVTRNGTTIDDVRALCIGAFWLSDLSWALSATAVRMATDLQLHRSFPKAIIPGSHNSKQHYLRARLYFLVYACDHHLSIPYGRPPMTRECDTVRNVRRFLECEHATEDDARIVSQVSRWRVFTAIFDTFGVDVDRSLSPGQVPVVRRFGIELDSLRAEWAERFGPSAHVGNYPRKGVGLQYHFAKLYLYSHAFRGGGRDDDGHMNHSHSPDMSLELEEIANSAFSAALSIVRTVVGDPEIQSFLDGLPAYFDTMIAFAAVFLLKVSTKFSASIQLDAREIRRLLNSLVETLERITSTMHPRHLLVSITRGIKSILQRHDTGSMEGGGGHTPGGTQPTTDKGKSVAETVPQQHYDEGGAFHSSAPHSNVNWDDGLNPSFDLDFLADYDFLQGHDIVFDFDAL